MITIKKLNYPLFALTCILLLSACNSLPKHAKYIPEDAAVVVGLNTGGLSKKVAWSAITGSKILDEIKESARNQKGKEALNDIEQSGIDFSSTLYFYAKPDKRFDKEAKMSIVAPLEDAKKWEAYVKKIFPAATISRTNDRSEALLDNKAYAAWTSDVLMVSNVAVTKTETPALAPQVDDAAATPAEADTTVADEAVDQAAAEATVAMPDLPTETIQQPDLATTKAEMEGAFKQDASHSIAENKRFKKLEGEGHDVTIFVAYGGLMDNIAARGDMGMMSSMLGGTMWKNSAMATGLDFEKGKIAGIMHYYPSDSMQAVAKECGAESIDKDILSRIPGQNLNMVMGYHLAPKGAKMLLDKMNLSGMANLFLMQKGLSVDEILNAFTGDMVVSINNMGTKPAVVSANPDMDPAPSKPNMDYVYAMKINKKESFNKLFALLTQEGGLQQAVPNTYTMPGMPDISLVVGDEYLAVANVAANAQAFLQKKGGNIPDAVNKEIVGHPVGAFFDIQSMMNASGAMGMTSATDSAMLAQVRKMFSNATLNGGEFKGDANEYHMALNLVNKDENSLLQLLQMAQRISQAKKRDAVAGNY